MKITSSIIYLLLIICICYFTFSLATDYQNNATRNQTSFVIWIIDTIDLFIHEAGHPIFGILGRFMNFLGGSLFQIIIPVTTVIVFAKSNLRSLPFTLYWTGQSTVNVSIYIGDAPFRQLQLISRAAIHDWWWLLSHMGIMEYAEDIANVVNALGILTCIVGIGLGFFFITRDTIQLLSPKEKSFPGSTNSSSSKVE